MLKNRVKTFCTKENARVFEFYGISTVNTQSDFGTINV